MSALGPCGSGALAAGAGRRALAEVGGRQLGGVPHGPAGVAREGEQLRRAVGASGLVDRAQPGLLLTWPGRPEALLKNQPAALVAVGLTAAPAAGVPALVGGQRPVRVRPMVRGLVRHSAQAFPRPATAKAGVVQVCCAKARGQQVQPGLFLAARAGRSVR